MISNVKKNYRKSSISQKWINLFFYSFVNKQLKRLIFINFIWNIYLLRTLWRKNIIEIRQIMKPGKTIEKYLSFLNNSHKFTIYTSDSSNREQGHSYQKKFSPNHERCKFYRLTQSCNPS